MGVMNEDRKKYLKEYKKQNLKRIPLDVPYQFYGEIYVHANECHESISGFIKRAIKETIERDRGPDYQSESDKKLATLREKLKQAQETQ